MTNQYKNIQRLQSHYSILDIILCLHDKLSSRYSVNYNSTELEQIIHPHRTSCRSSWLRGSGKLNLSPHSWIFTSRSVDSIPYSYLFTSTTVSIPVDTAPKCGINTYAIIMWRNSFERLRCSFTLSQKLLCQTACSYVWTEALLGKVFMLMQELSDVRAVIKRWGPGISPSYYMYEWGP